MILKIDFFFVFQKEMKIYNVIDNMNGICKNIFRLYILKSRIIIV